MLPRAPAAHGRNLDFRPPPWYNHGMQPIVTLTLPLDDARELYRALILRYFVEDTLRRERGLEPISLPVLAERIEKTLGLSQDQIQNETKRVEDELWQQAWLSFTDEWAWHRAKQDILKELAPADHARFTPEELEKLTEHRYESKLEHYLKEVELPGHESGGTCEWPASSNASSKNLKNKGLKKPSRNA